MNYLIFFVSYGIVFIVCSIGYRLSNGIFLFRVGIGVGWGSVGVGCKEYWAICGLRVVFGVVGLVRFVFRCFLPSGIDRREKM